MPTENILPPDPDELDQAVHAFRNHVPFAKSRLRDSLCRRFRHYAATGITAERALVIVNAEVKLPLGPATMGARAALVDMINTCARDCYTGDSC